MSGAGNLAAQQAEFMAQLLDDERALPPGWSERQGAGMAVYRNNYRSALVDALRETYERTARWVGEDAFRRAAAHHLITHPPASWTIDAAGKGFDATLAELFSGDPEVAELAWLEWAMHRAFTAADAQPLDMAGFAEATAGFGEDDWAELRLTFLPGTSGAPIAHDIPALWQGLAEDATPPAEYTLPEPLHCLVWRDAMRPVFASVSPAEGAAFAAASSGASYGAICELLVERLGEEAAVAEAGAILARWLDNGLIDGLA